MSRQTKRSKTKSEKLIKVVFCNTNKAAMIKTQEENNVIWAIIGTLLCLKVFDGINLTSHRDYFIKRYLSLHNNMSQIEIANKLNICKDTMGDYCKMYIQIFDECLDMAKILNAKVGFQITNLTRIITTFFLFEV